MEDVPGHAYARGCNVMWETFALAAGKGISIEEAVKRLGVWCDDMLKPWAEAVLEDPEGAEEDEFLLPPVLERQG